MENNEKKFVLKNIELTKRQDDMLTEALDSYMCHLDYLMRSAGNENTKMCCLLDDIRVMQSLIDKITNLKETI